MILCGWCGKPTTADRCVVCGHEFPERPWLQRGQQPPIASGSDDVRKRLVTARHAIEAEGRRATVEALAEELNVSPRTVRRWREMSV